MWICYDMCYLMKIRNPLLGYNMIMQGIIASGMTLFLQCYATQHGGPVLVGAYAPLQPVFTTFFSFIFLGETLFFGR